ncbi:mechanosensitive ion channel protein 10-like [Rhodamnia argentea]|uniref:Mechanosensitive ion channel protein n=1 Tax=Rhodamnia argentea TaxID=178133 RepID=A0ABM3HAX3_9MYRT|nr:mechanosensitive ion channel protein 10-like [Rhodamnia argentea]
MEVSGSSSEKKEANEVVVVIPGAECQSRRSSPKPNTEPIELENPPSSSHVSNLTSPSAQQLTQLTAAPSKLPSVPTKRSTSQSSFAKLKSRIMEPAHPSTNAEEDDDREVCETAHLESRGMLGEKKFVLAQWVAFACIMGLLIASLTISKLRNKVIWELQLWRWCLLMLAIFCGRLVTDWLINILVFLIEKDYLLKPNVLYFLFALKDSTEVFAWLCLVLLAWVWLINPGVKRSRHTTKILNWVTRALASCLMGAALWLVKTFLIKLLAASFQCKRFFVPIQEYVFHHHVIRTLSGPRPLESADKSVRTRFSIRGMVRKLEEVNIEKLSKMKRDKVSAWMMKGLIQIVSFSELSTLTGSLDRIDDDKADKDITGEKEAKKAASAIFKNVASESEFIEEKHLLDFMKKENVERFIYLFPGEAESRKIKKSSLKIWLVNVYRERKSLIRALKDAKTAIEELNSLVSAVLLVVVIILWLLLTGLMTTQMLIFVLSQLVLFGFIFGDSAKNLFGAIVFVFVMHPFDVSDRCVVDGVEMEVVEMNILTTVFLTNDGEKLFYPNSALASKPISNLDRSSNMSESVEFMVDFSASIESLGALKDKIKTYLDGKPKIWNLGHRVVVKEIGDAGHLKMALCVSHTMNFQNAAERTERRSNLVLELKKILEELHLQKRVLPQ